MRSRGSRHAWSGEMAAEGKGKSRGKEAGEMKGDGMLSCA